MPKLTKQFIELEIQPPVAGQCFYRVEDISGFAIRVTPKSKSYIFENRVDGVNRRITIAKCHEMSFDSARKQACTMLGVLAKGNNPNWWERSCSYRKTKFTLRSRRCSWNAYVP